MLGLAGMSGYAPLPKYEDHLAEQVEAVPRLRQLRHEFYCRELRKDIASMMPRAEAAGVGEQIAPVPAPAVWSPASLHALP